VSIRTVAVEAKADSSIRVLTPPVLANVETSELIATDFERSRLRTELERMLLVAADAHSEVLDCAILSLERSSLRYHRIRTDYEQARATMAAGQIMHGIGELVEPVADGSGGGSARTVTFRARPELTSQVLRRRAPAGRRQTRRRSVTWAPSPPWRKAAPWGRRRLTAPALEAQRQPVVTQLQLAIKDQPTICGKGLPGPTDALASDRALVQERAWCLDRRTIFRDTRVDVNQPEAGPDKGFASRRRASEQP